MNEITGDLFWIGLFGFLWLGVIYYSRGPIRQLMRSWGFWFFSTMLGIAILNLLAKVLIVDIELRLKALGFLLALSFIFLVGWVIIGIVTVLRRR